MGQVLHGSATTTEAVRRTIQHSQESLRVLARRHGINPKTVAKWKKRTSTADVPTGPKEPKSTVLSPEQEAIIVAFRRHTLLPLDKLSLRATGHDPAADALVSAPMPPAAWHLTAAGCRGRHPKGGEVNPGKQKFKTYPIGFFHIDIAEVRNEEGRLYLRTGVQEDPCSGVIGVEEGPRISMV